MLYFSVDVKPEPTRIDDKRSPLVQRTKRDQIFGAQEQEVAPADASVAELDALQLLLEDMRSVTGSRVERSSDPLKGVSGIDFGERYTIQRTLDRVAGGYRWIGLESSPEESMGGKSKASLTPRYRTTLRTREEMVSWVISAVCPPDSDIPAIMEILENHVGGALLADEQELAGLCSVLNTNHAESIPPDIGSLLAPPTPLADELRRVNANAAPPEIEPESPF